MSKDKPDQLLVAKESFVARFGGSDHVVTAGVTRVTADHPIVQGREHLFEPCGPSYGYESATAAPGERRG